MVLNIPEDLDSSSTNNLTSSDPLTGRTLPSGDLSYWPVPLAVASLLMLAATVPMVSGSQRGFGVSGDTSPYKGYSGIQVRPEAKRLVYFHEQTVAVLEVGDHRELYNCEFIEAYKPGELKLALTTLSEFAKPFRLTFDEMVELMNLCGQVAPPPSASGEGAQGRALPPIVNPVTLLNGILPGTKWCGTGDVASNYFDLGSESQLDKCCRAHDLCPVKVRAYSTRYNITNNSLYSKSHCTCDDNLRNCLRSAHSPTGDIMGNIYFNLLKVQCVRQGKDRTTFVSASRY